MKSIFRDITGVFKKSNNHATQIILISVFVFAFIHILKFSLSFVPNSGGYLREIQNNFYVSTDIIKLFQHPWTLLLLPFTNTSFIELLFNSLALYWLCNLLSDFIGSRKSMMIYVFGSLSSVVFYYFIFGLAEVLSKHPSSSIYIFGQSAGIYAIMYAIVALLPEYELSIFRLNIKFKYIALTFLVLSFGFPEGGVLNLGGAIFGYLNIKFLRSGIDIVHPIENIYEKMKTTEKTTPRNYTKTAVKEYQQSSNHTSTIFTEQEDVDHLLDKIGRSGYESLTKAEKERLYMFSQKKD